MFCNLDHFLGPICYVESKNKYDVGGFLFEFIKNDSFLDRKITRVYETSRKSRKLRKVNDESGNWVVSHQTDVKESNNFIKHSSFL